MLESGSCIITALLPAGSPCSPQVDEEASIRANTTVLLGNLANNLSGML